MYRRVLVPLDGSPLAERALAHAERIAAPGGEVVLFQVLEPEMTMPPISASEGATLRDAERVAREMREAVERARRGAERYLGGLRQVIGRGDVTLAERIEEGQPAERIVQAAGEVDVVVMSTHGRSGLAHLLMGSVAEQVIRRAKVPVLVIGPGHKAGR